jgi:hypothetical protein
MAALFRHCNISAPWLPHAHDTAKRLIADQRMRADTTGDVEILDVFWNTDQLPTVDDLVPPLLAYADLTGTTDGRNLEAAKMIYERLIEPTLRNRP